MADKHVQKLLRDPEITAQPWWDLHRWRHGFSSRMMVQAARFAMPQAYFVPVTPRQFRTTWSNGVDGSTPRSLPASTLSIKFCHCRPH